VGKPEGRNHTEDPGVDGRIILKWIFEKWDRGHRLEQMAGCCECGNEPSGSIKCGEFHDSMRNCQILRKDSRAAIPVYSLRII
jgi:hypothetical protein